MFTPHSGSVTHCPHDSFVRHTGPSSGAPREIRRDRQRDRHRSPRCHPRRLHGRAAVRRHRPRHRRPQDRGARGRASPVRRTRPGAGADVTVLAGALALDERIAGRFLRPGLGFGGGCLPKDIRAFTARAEEVGAGAAPDFLREIDAVNLRCRDRTADLVLAELDRASGSRRVAVLGASFRPGSDDVRDPPALDVVDGRRTRERLPAGVSATRAR
ncbi:hypothetical protein I4I84_15580 [Pseudonocardia sp. KRD-182]|nr:hypothetical protein [Pseudonocardia oceani]